MGDWIFDHMGELVLTLTLIIIIFCGFLFRSYTAERDAFMQECRQDHKAYECNAMWGGGYGRVR